jgi:hypothetical protein
MMRTDAVSPVVDIVSVKTQSPQRHLARFLEEERIEGHRQAKLVIRGDKHSVTLARPVNLAAI